MTALLWITVCIFCLKLAWNIGVPYELLRRKLYSKQAGVSGGISLMPTIEFFCLVFGILLSAVSNGDLWLNKPFTVALWGVILIVGSYIHLFLAGAVCGWIASKFSTKRNPDTKE